MVLKFPAKWRQVVFALKEAPSVAGSGLQALPSLNMRFLERVQFLRACCFNSVIAKEQGTLTSL